VKRYRIEQRSSWFHFEAEHVYVRDNGTLVLADADREMLLSLAPGSWTGVMIDEEDMADVEMHESHKRKPDLIFGYPIVETPDKLRAETEKVCREAAEWSEPKCNAEVCAERDEPRASRKSDPLYRCDVPAIARDIAALLEEDEAPELAERINRFPPTPEHLMLNMLHWLTERIEKSDTPRLMRAICQEIATVLRGHDTKGLRTQIELIAGAHQANITPAVIAERLCTLLEEGKGLGLVGEIAARMPKDDRVLTEEQYEEIVNRVTQRTADRCIELTYAERDKVAARVVAIMLGSSFPSLKHEIEKVVDCKLEACADVGVLPELKREAIKSQ